MTGNGDRAHAVSAAPSDARAQQRRKRQTWADQPHPTNHSTRANSPHGAERTRPSPEPASGVLPQTLKPAQGEAKTEHTPPSPTVKHANLKTPGKYGSVHTTGGPGPPRGRHPTPGAARSPHPTPTPALVGVRAHASCTRAHAREGGGHPDNLHYPERLELGRLPAELADDESVLNPNPLASMR